MVFQKYEGLGNDFIIVEVEHEDAVSPELARELCDRRRGIGGDGVLVLLPPSTSASVARMRVLNADGSVPEMCGNGLRCAVLHVARSRRLAVGELTFETDAGLRICSVDDREGLGEITVDMGIVRVLGDLSLQVTAEESWDFVLADAGNPHAITTRPTTLEEIHVVGPRVATNAHFPAGTNVEFAAFKQGEVDLIVWERGVGVTLACGTGACATVAVGAAKGLVSRNEPIRVNLPGGGLHVTVQEDGRVIMRGPARHVFSGEVSR